MIAAVDDHQRAMWSRMLDEITDFQLGRLELGRLIDDLRGLGVEADPHDADLRDQLTLRIAELEMEHELRTEPWAPQGAASDDRLKDGIEAMGAFVWEVLATSETTEHG
jgi:hypothetical protein